jgi:hypothetical protein
MFVKPAPGLIVRDPLHMTPLPAEGRNVPDITYWHRLLGHGDVVLADAPEEAAVDPTSDASVELQPGDLTAEPASGLFAETSAEPAAQE